MNETASPAAASSLVAAGLTDTGRVRPENQDAFLVFAAEGVLAVADGMGGHRRAGVAARTIIHLLPAALAWALQGRPTDSPEAALQALRGMVVRLGDEVRKRAEQDADLAGMGATLALVCVRGSRGLVVHAGDSRVYLLRRGRLSCLTEDHTLVAQLVKAGGLTAAQARTHPERARLSRFVGAEFDAHPDGCAIDLEAGDRLLLCTDGLTGMLGDERILATLAEGLAPLATCRRLVDAANSAGGEDNVTVVVADWRGPSTPSAGLDSLVAGL